NAEDGSNLSVHGREEPFGRERDCFWIGGASQKTGEQDVTLRSEIGKQRRIPDRAEYAQARGARHKESESLQRLGYVFASIAERDDRHWGVFNGREERLKCWIHIAQQFSGD